MPQPADQPRQLFTKESGRNQFHGLLFSLRSGDLLLIPIHEIVSAATLALGGGGCVEIHTRRQLIRLGMSSMDACREFVMLLFKGEVSHVHEGTAPLRAERSGFDKDQRPPPPVTLAIEIIDLDAAGEDGATGSPPPPADPPAQIRRPGSGLGFPTL